ncbi:hypothetical protein BKA14_008290 [Actinoplanes abujensis]|uniref:Uncharacterized protein n=1 Tax=Paractinoplanes abujensis TaxID=882441 RepID=A0A7W7D0S7_9ACTN|nr:hypothetical protein [Actinoplanes abujensis]
MRDERADERDRTADRREAKLDQRKIDGELTHWNAPPKT